MAVLADHLGGDERVGAGAGAEIEHALAGCEATERPRVGHAGERLGRAHGHPGELGRVAEVFRPGAAGREDELGLGLLGDR